MCLKTENYCLKTFVKFLWMKKYIKIYEILFKNWKLLFENTNQTLFDANGVFEQHTHDSSYSIYKRFFRFCVFGIF